MGRYRILVHACTLSLVLLTGSCSVAAQPVVTTEAATAALAALQTLTVAPETRCSAYDRDDYPYPQSVEQRIIAQLGGIWSPYTLRRFASATDTDIEHMVSLSEAHDSGLCLATGATRRAFARDLDNLTLASPEVNRYQKKALDAAEWLPEHNRCWFAARLVAVRAEYGLTIDAREHAALRRVLSGCKSVALVRPQGGSKAESAPAAASVATPSQDHPPAVKFRNCAALRSAGWTLGVRRNGGTYRDSWDAAERRTYSLNPARDGDKDGHACE
jgi:hypothetical protein